MLLLSVASLGLLGTDHLTDLLGETRSILTLAVTPIIVIADYPSRSVTVAQEALASRGDMRIEIVDLR
ncbi:MAG: hypothetical protein ACI8VR_001691, partial [Candidatus Azotimanducaceae bacterium]